MWHFNRDFVGDDYDEAPIGKRGYFWPGMWHFSRNRKQFEKRGYFWPGMWQYRRSDEQPMDGGESGAEEKRATFWPGMWRHRQPPQPIQVSRRSSYMYERYWLGKACGETGDLYACSVLNGIFDY